MMMVMGGYSKDYAGAVQAANEMSSVMIEYINGIEVIKAFNQGKKSYARFVDKVRANAQYYYDWMRRSQLGMSMAYAFFPAQMLTMLKGAQETLLAALEEACGSCDSLCEAEATPNESAEETALQEIPAELLTRLRKKNLCLRQLARHLIKGDTVFEA